MAFIASKTYINLESYLSLPGVTAFYTCIGLFGLVVGYFIIPETENRSLEDIELHFSNNALKLTDRKIQIDAIGKDVSSYPGKPPSVIFDMISNDRAKHRDTGKNAGIYNESFTGREEEQIA